MFIYPGKNYQLFTKLSTKLVHNGLDLAQFSELCNLYREKSSLQLNSDSELNK